MSEQKTKAPGKKGWIIAVIGVAVLASARAILFTQVILPGNRYKAAEELAAEGDGYAATLASEHLEDSEDAQPHKMEFFDLQSVAAAGMYHTVVLRSDGTVVATVVPNAYYDFGQWDVADWTDIIAVAVGLGHTVGLCSDGTVVAAGNNDYGQCDVADWTDIRTPD